MSHRTRDLQDRTPRDASLYSLERAERLTTRQARRIAGSGYTFCFLNLTELAEHVSREFLRCRPGIELSFPVLEMISPETAAHLVSSHTFLKLGGITHLTTAVASVLGRAPHWLDLGGITQLSVEKARLLAVTEGWLSLRGLTQLTPALAQALSRHRGVGLSLGGITELTDLCAAHLAAHQGACLRLAGIRNPSGKLRSILAHHKSEVLFHVPARYRYQHEGD